MENDRKDLQNQEKQQGQDINLTNDNKNLQENDSSSKSGDFLPEDDPALINPDELASFPKEQKNNDPDIEDERDSHLTTKIPSPVREGRNITRTDPSPDRDGFM